MPLSDGALCANEGDGSSLIGIGKGMVIVLLEGWGAADTGFIEKEDDSMDCGYDMGYVGCEMECCWETMAAAAWSSIELSE